MFSSGLPFYQIATYKKLSTMLMRTVISLSLISLYFSHSFGQHADSLQLKNRFNLENAYVHFHFDYDSLSIDTVINQSNNFESVRIYGYVMETDSFRSNDDWIKFLAPQTRFFVIIEENELTYVHEEFFDKFGHHYVKYEYHPNSGMKIYETFTEGGNGIQIREQNGETTITLDDKKVCVMDKKKRKRGKD